MASVLGTNTLKSYLSEWRSGRPGAAADDRSPPRRSASRQSAGGTNVQGVGGSASDLSLLLENLVIPQLIASCGTSTKQPVASDTPVRRAPAERAISDAELAELARVAVHEDAQALLVLVEHYLASGHSVETIYIELLAPAARKLGEYWERDSEDFVGVTMGLWRIQEVLRELALHRPPLAPSGMGMRAALFSAMPGEQHSFGTLMVSEFFERAGWQCDALIEPTRPELTGKFASQHYDLIGLTVSCDCPSGALAELVTTIRTVSRNRHVKVLLGGRAINAQPGLVAAAGADGTAIDAPAAVALADQLVPVMFARLAQ